MPQTYGEIIDRVLRNAGDARGDNTLNRAAILQDILNLIEFDLAGSVGEIYVTDSITMTLGGVSGSADGAYDIPDGVRSVRGPFLIDGDALAGHSIYRDPDLFWRRFDRSSTQQGRPQQVLIHGLEFVFRPIPDFGGATDYEAEIFVTLYPTFSVTEGATVPRREFEAPLEAGATWLHATRNSMSDVANTYARIYQRWLQQISRGATDYVRPKQAFRPHYL